MAFMDPTKKNFLQLIEDRIEEYEALKENYDFNIELAAKGALLELQCLKSIVLTRIASDKEK